MFNLAQTPHTSSPELHIATQVFSPHGSLPRFGPAATVILAKLAYSKVVQQSNHTRQYFSATTLTSCLTRCFNTAHRSFPQLGKCLHCPDLHSDLAPAAAVILRTSAYKVVQHLHPYKHLPCHLKASVQASITTAPCTPSRPSVTSIPIALPVICFISLQAPCHAALPAASLSRAITYRPDLNAPYSSTRPYMPLAKNQSAQCAYYHGAVTPREAYPKKTASSAVSKHRATQEKTSQNSRKMGTSMPGCLVWPWRIRPSRLNYPSSRSRCVSCSLSQARLLHSWGENRQLELHPGHPNHRPHPVRWQAFHRLPGHSPICLKGNQALYSFYPSLMPGSSQHSTTAVLQQGQ